VRESTRQSPPFARRLFLATRAGLAIGVVYAILAIAQIALGGTELLTANGLTPGLLISFYVGGGLLGGVIAGLLLPVAMRHVLLAMLIGYLALFPFSLVIATAITLQSTVSPLQIAPITSLAGALAGWMIWKEEQPRHKKSKDGSS